jgi:hypothetical protein
VPQSNQTLKVVLAAARQLPSKLQKQLAEQLIAASVPDRHTTVVYLQRLAPQKQARLEKLMDKSNEGRLSQAERAELKRLNQTTEHSYTLRGHRPELSF